MQEMVDKSTGIERQNIPMNPEGRDFEVKRRLSGGRQKQELFLPDSELVGRHQIHAPPIITDFRQSYNIEVAVLVSHP